MCEGKKTTCQQLHSCSTQHIVEKFYNQFWSQRNGVFVEFKLNAFFSVFLWSQKNGNSFQITFEKTLKIQIK